jgi:hypothetical protein
MRFLSDTEILSWNRRLKDHWSLYPKYGYQHSHPVIVIRQIVRRGGIDELAETTDPHIKFEFIFSVSNNRVDDFFRIFDKLKSEKFGTHWSFNDTEKLIDLDTRIIVNKSTSEHRIGNKDFIRHQYSLEGKLTSVMALVTILEDTIHFVDSMWGYDTEGVEVNLIKFPIGSVVSPKDNKSEDWLVIDYEFEIFNNKHEIRYRIAQMKFSKNSSVIKYEDVGVYSEDLLTWSRNSRIDEILN